MTTNPIPFITRLKRESDGFANALHLAALAPGAVLVGWWGLDLAGILGPINAVFAAYTRYALIAWLTFFGLAALIDYTIFAVFRAFTEWLDAAIAAARSSFQSEAVSTPIDHLAPDQRDSTVAYLHDFIKRSRQATDAVDPLNPNSAA